MIIIFLERDVLQKIKLFRNFPEIGYHLWPINQNVGVGVTPLWHALLLLDAFLCQYLFLVIISFHFFTMILKSFMKMHAFVYDPVLNEPVCLC